MLELMAENRRWKDIVLSLREKAKNLSKSHPDAALMMCRKAMEGIQYSIFDEKNGELPSTYIPFEKMMGKTVIGDLIPAPHQIEFGTVQTWGNYGSHYQVDGEPTEQQVELALGALDNLIAWRFPSARLNPFAPGRPAALVEAQKKMDQVKRLHMDEVPFPEHLIARSVEVCARDGGWALLSNVGKTLRQLSPGFRVNSTGHSKLIDLVKTYPDFFEIKAVTHGTIKHYRIRNQGRFVKVSDS
jgi:hypothetical protein